MKRIILIALGVSAVLAAWRFTTEPISEKYRGKTLIRWVTDGNPARREQIAAFEALHPDIHVVWDYGGDGMQKTMVQISGKRGPDLFDIYTTDVFYQFASSDALYDLEGLIREDNQRIESVNGERFERNLELLEQRGVAAAPDLERFPRIRDESLAEFGDYNRVAIEFNRRFGLPENGEQLALLEYPMTHDLFWPGLRDMISYQGKIYAVPTNTSGNVITYNRDIFEHWNVPFPEPAWNTDDFIEIAKQLSVKQPGRNVYETFAFIPVWPSSFVFAAGGGYFTGDRRGVILDQPEGARALAFVGRCYGGADGVRLAPTISDSLAGAENIADWPVNFKAGRVAMASCGRWILSFTGPTFRYGYAPIPYFPKTPPGKRSVKLACRTTAVSRDCRHPEAAFAFLRYLAGREYGNILHQGGDGFSGVKYYAQEDWATFHPTFPEVQCRMGQRIRRRMADAPPGDPVLTVSIEEAEALRKHESVPGEEAKEFKPSADRARAKRALLENLRDGKEPLAGLKEEELNALAAVEWENLPEAEKARHEAEVRDEMRMLLDALGEARVDEYSPYIPSTSYRISQDLLQQQVQRGTVKPEEWASRLADIFRGELAKAFDPDRNRTKYLVANIAGWGLLALAAPTGVWCLIRRGRRRRRGEEPDAAAAGGIRERLAALAFLSPNLLGFLVFTSLPVAFSLIIAFTNLNTLSRELSYAGFSHFADLISSGRFWYFFFNTVVFMLGMPISVAASLALAVILSNRLQGNVAFRTIFYMPSVVSGVAIFLLWKWIYNPEYGLLNQAIRAILHYDDPPAWLAGTGSFLGITFFWAKPALIFMGIWMSAGGPNMLLYLAGLSAIPPELYEAAAIDGAGAWHRFRHITWPLLSPTTFFILIMGIIGGLQGGFEMAYIMTGGGPELSTTTMGYHIFQTAFLEFRMGAAAAAAWFLFVLILGVTLVSWRYGNRAVHYTM